MKYPKHRVQQIEMQLKWQKQKWAEEKAEKERMRDKLIEQQQANFRLCQITKQFEDLRMKVHKVYIPAINKEALMKGQIHELYMKLGKTDDQAWQQTYKDIHEYDSLSQHMSRPEVMQNFIKVQTEAGNLGDEDEQK